MRISLNALKEILENYKKELINKRIEDILLVNSRLFLFKIKNLSKSFIVDLDNTNPHIGLIKTEYNELSLPSNFIAIALNKGKPLIKNIELVNNDHIIKITTSTFDSYYHNNNYYLYIELIASHANMILVDDTNKIITAFYETNINAPRVICKKFTYQLPNKKYEEKNDSNFSFKEYSSYLINAFNNSLKKRKEELYGNYLKKCEKKVKSLSKKLLKVEDGIKKAHEENNYINLGNEILMHSNEIKKGDKVFNNIKLDPTKSPIENANNYFAKYKKAKRTIEISKDIIDQIKNEIDLENYKIDLFNLSKEKDLNTFIKEENNNRKNNVKIKESKAYLPYFIKYKDTIYYFGHNALENDYLTFKMFNKKSKVIWMHLKNIPSSHLIINKENPSNEELDIACSILLLLNKMESGEIMYTSRNLITRDKELARANILNYKSINMRKINNIAYTLLSKEKKVNG